ncbi:hypothetical protein H8S33_06335 [Ornithinibacillus sp. BX22]|uniref:Replicative helicase inhibitor G39P N-terminal domain-containing protein n=1 Tax=Ornithinibacillus hominis TaxID=2763055 RepID=A0A923RHA9_9BACI|nr:hypothetical protein [Ornithinibacillus hominis]
MNRQEAIDILQLIKELYPKFNVKKERMTFLIPLLEKMDYQQVMDNLTHYVSQNPFPPTIADIAAPIQVENDYLEEMQVWAEEAQQVAPEVKARFHTELQNLVRKKSGYEAGKL